MCMEGTLAAAGNATAPGRDRDTLKRALDLFKAAGYELSRHQLRSTATGAAVHI